MDDMQIHKLERFNKSVDMEVSEHIDRIIEEAKKQVEIQLEKTESDALTSAFNMIQKSVREIEAKYRRMYALAEQKNRVDALKHREKLSKTIFENVESELKSFTESDRYELYLRNLISEEKLSENAIIELSQKDQKYADKLKEVSGCDVRIDETIKIGGISIVDPDHGIINDKTLDGSLEDQKKSFSSKYSFRYQSL